MKLNVGCGYDHREGYVNLDRVMIKGVNCVFDLDSGDNLPFPDNTFDEILAFHILEHITDMGFVMKELYRVLKPDGQLIIRYPYYTHPNAWFGIDHKRCLTHDVFRQFYYKAPKEYYIDTPKFREFSYEYHLTGVGKLMKPFVSWMRHLCNILILEEEVTLTK